MSYFMQMSELAGYERCKYPTLAEVKTAIANHDHLSIFRWKNGIFMPISKKEVRVYNLLSGYLNQLGLKEQMPIDSIGNVDPGIRQSVERHLKLIYARNGGTCRIGHKCESFSDCVSRVSKLLSQ